MTIQFQLICLLAAVLVLMGCKKEASVVPEEWPLDVPFHVSGSFRASDKDYAPFSIRVGMPLGQTVSNPVECRTTYGTRDGHKWVQFNLHFPISTLFSIAFVSSEISADSVWSEAELMAYFTPGRELALTGQPGAAELIGSVDENEIFRVNPSRSSLYPGIQEGKLTVTNIEDYTWAYTHFYTGEVRTFRGKRIDCTFGGGFGQWAWDPVLQAQRIFPAYFRDCTATILLTYQD